MKLVQVTNGLKSLAQINTDSKVSKSNQTVDSMKQ